MSSLLVELEQKNILTAEAVSDIRSYIDAKFPSMPSNERARVFADTVNKVVDRHIPGLSKEQKLKLKDNLYRDAFSRPFLKLDKSQVFIAALGVRANEEDAGYYKEMASWLGGSLGYELDENSVASLIIRVQRLKDEIPGYGIADALNAVEQGLMEASAETADISGDATGENEYGITGEVPEAATGNAFVYGKDGLEAEEPMKSGLEADFEVNGMQYEKEPAVMQMIDECALPSQKSRRSSFRAYAGRVLVAAGFTGLILSSLLDFNIFISTGAQDDALYRDVMAIIPAAYQDSPESQEYVSPYIMDFNTGNEIDNATGLWKGKKTLKATAYDLSIESCGKLPDDPCYGITASGVKASKGRTIAVDPKIIPLGTRVYITFPEEYKHMNGIYVAEDTGKLVKGLHIDIFFGEDRIGEREVYKKAMNFGVRHVEVEILGT